MSSLFTAISGHFTKAIFVGAMFPATLFVLAAYIFVLPMVPWDVQVLSQFEALDNEWRLAVVGTAALVLGFLLYLLNKPIIRFYEGYPWKEGLLGEYLSGKAKKTVLETTAKRDQLSDERQALNDEIDQTNKADKPRLAWLKGERAKVTTRERPLILLQWRDYPDAEFILPTKFGNVIRAFEMYPQRQYNIAAITLWPRLIAKMEDKFAETVDDSKTSVDFAINSSLLATLLTITLIVLGLAFPVPFEDRSLLWLWMAKIAVCTLVAWFMYRVAVGAAATWGALVRSAFDLYRRPLLESLGFTPPADLEEEKRLWYRVSQQLAYGEPLRVPVPPGKPGVTPRNAELEVAHGVATTKATRTHYVRVKNPTKVPVEEVVLTETVPEGRVLVWSSVRIDNSAAEFTGANPYRINVGDLGPKSEALVTYETIEA